MPAVAIETFHNKCRALLHSTFLFHEWLFLRGCAFAHQDKESMQNKQFTLKYKPMFSSCLQFRWCFYFLVYIVIDARIFANLWIKIFFVTSHSVQSIARVQCTFYTIWQKLLPMAYSVNMLFMLFFITQIISRHNDWCLWKENAIRASTSSQNDGDKFWYLIAFYQIWLAFYWSMTLWIMAYVMVYGCKLHISIKFVGRTMHLNEFRTNYKHKLLNDSCDVLRQWNFSMKITYWLWNASIYTGSLI